MRSVAGLPSLRQIILWLFVIACIAYATGGLIMFLDGGRNAGKADDKVTPVHIPLNNAEKFLLSLKMEQGTIHVSSGTGQRIINGTLTSRYSVSGPIQSYSESNNTGILMIGQESSMFYEVIDKEDEWNLSIPRDIPTDISIHCHMGDVSLTSGSLDLSSLEIMAGTGDVLVDLSSYHGNNLPVVITAGIGSVKILLPPDMTVAAIIENGIGSRTVSGLEGQNGRYFYRAESDDSQVISLSVKQGLGDLTLTRMNGR